MRGKQLAGIFIVRDEMIHATVEPPLQSFDEQPWVRFTAPPAPFFIEPFRLAVEESKSW